MAEEGKEMRKKDSTVILCDFKLFQVLSTTGMDITNATDFKLLESSCSEFPLSMAFRFVSVVET